MRTSVGFLILIALLAWPRQAAADVTAFLGTTPTPDNRAVKGIGVGAGLLIVAFEFEYASTSEEAATGAPALRTGMGNVLLQTPFPVAGLQPYFTTGGGIYRERLGDRQETSFGGNVGGGVKINLAGPLRLRLDYRVFTLQGDPLYGRVQRVYAGVNLKL
jgi:opacity protein-like surface antigen